MKKINSKEYKKIILDILKYIDKICRENNLHYTLIGGSLIGAIREKGIIPWDDDIDIVMSKEDYFIFEKEFIKGKNKQYNLLNNSIYENYPITYTKIIDVRTIAKEPNAIELDEYGAFVDVFVNHNAPNNKLIQKFHYYNILFWQKMINRYLLNDNYTKQENIIKRIVSWLAKKIGVKKLQKHYNKVITKYDKKTTNYRVKDLVGFGFSTDIVKVDMFNDYIDVDFEDMKAMAIKEYDKYLTRIFGDYMTPPSKENQICHNIEAYWKDGIKNEKK